MTIPSYSDLWGKFNQIRLIYESRKAIVADLKEHAVRGFSAQGWDALGILVSDIHDGDGFALAFAGRCYDVRMVNSINAEQDTFTLAFGQLIKHPNEIVELLPSSYIHLDELGNALSVWSVVGKRSIPTTSYMFDALLAALRHAASAATEYAWPPSPPAPSAHPA